MISVPPDFAAQYQRALNGYLADGGEAALNLAYELGRQALNSGVGILNLVNIHGTALAEVLKDDSVERKDVADRVAGAGRFLIETLSPFEMFHLGNRESNVALRRLNAALEEEARRIAHVLHDESAQLLATVYLEVAQISREVPEPVQSRVNRITDHLDQVREQLRRLSHELRPPILDQLGLVPALRFLSDGVQKRSGLEISVDGTTEARLPAVVETALYRVCQEALNNVTRHADAAKAGIRILEENGVVRCIVWDDGVGFEWHGGSSGARDGLGLIGIKERVGALYGRLEITSAPDKGTELQIIIPVNQD